jgi:hypothetical protein
MVKMSEDNLVELGAKLNIVITDIKENSVQRTENKYFPWYGTIIGMKKHKLSKLTPNKKCRKEWQNLGIKNAYKNKEVGNDNSCEI